MYLVVEFEDHSVAIVLQSWMVGDNQVLWGRVNSKQLNAMLLHNLPAPASAVIYNVKVHKATGKFCPH